MVPLLWVIIAEIGREFDKVFKELFGGGKGTLDLIQEEDILEAGIRITAQPPGKHSHPPIS